MEANNRARSRLFRLARHVGSIQEDHASRHARNSSLSVLACSAGGWDAFQRRDNRTLFARQSSDSHGQFMRQAPMKQDIPGGDAQVDAALKSASRPGPDGVCKCGSSSARNNTKEAPDYIRGPSFAAIEPLFGRPAIQTGPIEKLVREVPARNPEPEMPAPCQESESSLQGRSNNEGAQSGQSTASDVEKQKEGVSHTTKVQTPSDSFGFEWFPRMDVVESGTAYVITVELPGVSADGIHVEVVRGSLIVTGSRATDWWKEKQFCQDRTSIPSFKATDWGKDKTNGNGTVYHRRELAQGPYRAVWRLPKNGDINGITAEFIDGFLRVLVPKIKVMTYL